MIQKLWCCLRIWKRKGDSKYLASVLVLHMCSTLGCWSLKHWRSYNTRCARAQKCLVVEEGTWTIAWCLYLRAVILFRSSVAGCVDTYSLVKSGFQRAESPGWIPLGRVRIVVVWWRYSSVTYCITRSLCHLEKKGLSFSVFFFFFPLVLENQLKACGYYAQELTTCVQSLLRQHLCSVNFSLLHSFPSVSSSLVWVSEVRDYSPLSLFITTKI